MKPLHSTPALAAVLLCVVLADTQLPHGMLAARTCPKVSHEDFAVMRAGAAEIAQDVSSRRIGVQAPHPRSEYFELSVHGQFFALIDNSSSYLLIISQTDESAEAELLRRFLSEWCPGAAHTSPL
jgi:hypothetical protein